MADAKTFMGYGPEQGYEFLRAAIRENDYAARGAEIGTGEIFVSDGSKCDTGNIQELLATDCRIGVTDPVYPVCGHQRDGWTFGRIRRGGPRSSRILPTFPPRRKNGFVPALPEGKVDVMYLCSPNNPTGTAMTKEELKVWVDWANETGALILFDGAYEHLLPTKTYPQHFTPRSTAQRPVRSNPAAFPKRRAFTARAARIPSFRKSLSGETAKAKGEA